LTVPFPLPLLPEVMVIQAALLEADQAQPAPAVTITFPAPPVEGNNLLTGEIE
jgi:hypothetical protein